MILFMAVMLALGGVDVLGRGSLTPEKTGDQVWMGVFLTFALLHYYYDGFIWKARESALGNDLGIQSGLRATVVPGLRHSANWGLFFVPIALIMAFGEPYKDRRTELEALVAVAPDDFLNQAELGLELVRAREFSAAIEHYRRSIALNPDLTQSRANFGAALDLAGELDEAKVQYEAALKLEDHAGAHAQAHVNLGVLLLARGDQAAAAEHFKAGRELGGANPMGRILALAKEVPAADYARRQGLLGAALTLDPNNLEPRFQLANLLLEQRNYQAAAGHFQFLVNRAPHVSHGMVGLATCQAELGKVGAAREMLKRALKNAPDEPNALALKKRLGL